MIQRWFSDQVWITFPYASCTLSYIITASVASGAAGFIVGMLFVLILPQVLPFGAAERVAASILGEEPWQAGIRLMKFGNPLGLS